MNPLETLIRQEIAQTGPMSLARYMELALQHPDHGYYRAGDPLGRAGDFVTAPEISQMFGELIGLWLADAWAQLGRPDPFVLLELGPGRGTLMVDILRATAKIDGFAMACRLHLIESNQTLRAQQQVVLSGASPVFVDDIAALPPMPLFFVANEFFDAMPIHQFVRAGKIWRERMVGMKGDQLAWTDSHEGLSLFLAGVEGGASLRETSPLAVMWAKHLAEHIKQHSGAGLIFDYGYTTPSGASTLQAVSRHQMVDPLTLPGQVDLTAHVDFVPLARAAAQAGVSVYGPQTQGAFLEVLGISLRAAQLKLRASPEQAAAIDDAYARLTDPGAMGTLFKVMGLSWPDLPQIAGFV